MVIGFRGAILRPQSNGKNKLKSGLCDPVHHGDSVVDISQSVRPDTRLSARAACIASSHLTSQRLGGGIEQNYRVEPSQDDRGLSGACNRIRRRVPQRSDPTTYSEVERGVLASPTGRNSGGVVEVVPEPIEPGTPHL